MLILGLSVKHSHEILCLALTIKEGRKWGKKSPEERVAVAPEVWR